jgi:hypothetical protein
MRGVICMSNIQQYALPVIEVRPRRVHLPMELVQLGVLNCGAELEDALPIITTASGFGCCSEGAVSCPHRY